MPDKIRASCLLLSLLIPYVHAETGYDMWLRYQPLPEPELSAYRHAVPAVLAVSGESPEVNSARDELVSAVRVMLGRTLRLESGFPKEPAILLGTSQDLHLNVSAPFETYALKTLVKNGVRYTVITGSDDRSVLYGAFAFLRKLQLGDPVANLNEQQSPYAAIRWVNEWDNLDGSIERGYAGRSIFWHNLHAREDLSRVKDYARLLASLGINACSINNVNANPRVLAPDFVPEIARIASAMRPWGVRVAIAVDFGSPKSIGGLDTFDPLESRVAEWWTAAANRIYAAIPDLAGFVLKADSEGRVGPSAYNRTHADAANVVARALKPHGGLLFYRGFVYDHHMDWRDPKNDRARAAFDNFKPLDGRFDDNVVVQIKNGPIDFQVREPPSPLFGGLQKTNQAIELQITQEYSGQARQLVFLPPQWKTVLDFDTHARGQYATVKALAAGKIFHRPTGGFVGVANVGLDDNWCGNQLSQANLYGFGRLAWNPNLTSEEIAAEWTRLTFGRSPQLVRTITGMLLRSWRTYEDYTGPLGLQTLTDIVGNHYGVNVEASERNGWGQWHRADEHGVGMDRTVATGTGFTGQYSPAVSKMFESLTSCPDDLLLFFHHVPYTHILHSGKTVIQYLYDSHYEGPQSAEKYVTDWESLRGQLDQQRYLEVLAMLQYQAGQAQVWRDAVTRWFLRESSIPDAHGRVGHYPGRTEAEDMQLEGYSVVDVTPWEAVSGGKAVVCPTMTCSAALRFDGAPGWYTIHVQYFDQNNGVSRFDLFAGNQLVDEWAASLRLPTQKIDASSSTRRAVSGIALRPGDWIRIEGIPDGGEPAALDYMEILPRP